MGELKTIDVDPATYAGNTTPDITLLNGVATGTDFTQRIGRKIVMKSLYLRGYVESKDTTTTNCLWRTLIVYDNQSNGAAPIITDILKSSNVTSHVNLDNRDRFKILFDREFALAPIDTTATQSYCGAPTILKFKKYLRLNHEVLFNGTAATVGSIATGSIYMVNFSDVAAATGGSAVIATRIRFSDA